MKYCLVVSLLMLHSVLSAGDQQVGCLATIKKFLCCCFEQVAQENHEKSYDFLCYDDEALFGEEGELADTSSRVKVSTHTSE